MVAVASDCRHCQASAGYLREMAGSRAGRFKLILIGRSERDVRSFLTQNDLAVDAVVGADLRALGIWATPTYLVVDQNGQVQRSWVGKLSPEDELNLNKSMGFNPANRARGDE